jgi:hypothetical protein
MIKATVKAYLEDNTGLFHHSQGCLDPGNRPVYGFFTEDMLPRFGGGNDEIRMGIGSAANHHPVNGGVPQNILGIPRKESYSQAFGPGFLFLGQYNICNTFESRTGNPLRAMFSMDLPDPAKADKP